MNVSDVKVSDEGGYLSRNMSIVFQPSRPDTGSPLFEECVIAVRVESDLLFESYLRDVTDEMRSPWKLRCGVNEFADGDQRCAATREYSAAWLSCDCQDDTEHRGNPNCARAQVVAMFHTSNSSCLFFSAHLPARCTACPFGSAVFVDSARKTDSS